MEEFALKHPILTFLLIDEAICVAGSTIRSFAPNRYYSPYVMNISGKTKRIIRDSMERLIKKYKPKEEEEEEKEEEESKLKFGFH